MKLFMLGAVCRVFHPGIKFETVRTVFERSVRNITSVTKDVIALYETSDVMEIGTASKQSSRNIVDELIEINLGQMNFSEP